MFTTEDIDAKELPSADVYVFFAPAEAFRVQKNMRKFLKNLPSMPDQNYAIINTHGMKRNWLSSMEKILSKKQMNKIVALDFKMDKDVEHGDGLQEGWQQQLDAFAAKLTQ